jgi:hypothetical protein
MRGTQFQLRLIDIKVRDSWRRILYNKPSQDKKDANDEYSGQPCKAATQGDDAC